jgi:hypothetical protein
MDADIIAEHAEGIIATTGCPSGEVQTRLRLGQVDEAIASAVVTPTMVGLLAKGKKVEPAPRLPGTGKAASSALHRIPGDQLRRLRLPRRTGCRNRCA